MIYIEDQPIQVCATYKKDYEPWNNNFDHFPLN